FVCVQQSRSEMIPGEILDYAMSRRGAHFLHDLRMSVQVFQRCRDRVHISWFHNNALSAIADDVAGLARGDLRQTACRRFICDLSAAFPLRRENVDRALAEIILRVTHESNRANVVAPELL